MKIFFPVITVLFLTVLFANTANAQLVKIGVGMGLTKLQSPSLYTNNFAIQNVDPVSGYGTVTGYGLGNAYHFGLEAKFNIPLVPITPVAFIDYHLMKGTGNADSMAYSTSQNIFTIGVELEYFIIHLPFVSPYVAVNASENFFGKLETDVSQTGTAWTYPAENRMGGGVGVGAEITLPPIDFDLSLKYNYFNLIGKSSGEQNINSLNLNLELLF